MDLRKRQEKILEARLAHTCREEPPCPLPLHSVTEQNVGLPHSLQGSLHLVPWSLFRNFREYAKTLEILPSIGQRTET